MQTEQKVDKKIADPVQEYLEGLRWDGVERVSKWVKNYLGDHTTEANAAGQRWLIQAVARAFEPGCQADGVLVLKGKQGGGKSTALKTLGGRWFINSADDVNRELFVNLLGKWVVELTDLNFEDPVFAIFVSNRDDYFRGPYDKQPTVHPRRCVFAATTNNDLPANAPRRFWLVQVTKVSTEALQRDRDQIWAEAVHMFKNKTPWWPAS